MAVTIPDISSLAVVAACGHNAGGIHALRLIPAANVAAAAAYGPDGTLLRPMVLHEAGNYADVAFSTGGFEEPVAETDDGPVWKPRIEVYVPAGAAAALAAALPSVPLVCLFADYAGRVFLAGGPHEPLYFTATAETGADYADRYGRRLRFAGEATGPARPYLDMAAAVARKVFSNGFTRGFLRTP